MNFRMSGKLFDDGFVVNGSINRQIKPVKSTAEVVCGCVIKCFLILAGTVIALQYIAWC